MIGGQRGVDTVMIEKRSGDPGIFSRDKLDLTQYAYGTKRHVFLIADRSADEIERTCHAAPVVK
jgi:hypothetical protein